MPDVLPDADMLVRSAIVAAIPAIKLGTQIPDDLLSHLPYATAKRIGGSAVDPRFLDNATIDVQTWAGGANGRAAAYALASQIRLALRDAASNQTVYTEGHFSRFVEISAPAELRTADQAGNLWRFQATYSLFLRPAAT